MNTPPVTRRTCDIVMKGGITSGVVYPGAIAKLAERFDFVNIGGSSAGAIAAAIAAAAQYRRISGGSEEGFAQLDRLPTELGSKVGKRDQTRLFTLFPANQGTQSLFAVATAGLGNEGSRAWRVVRTLLRQYRVRTISAGLPGIVLLVWSSFHASAGPIAWVWFAIAVGLTVVGGVVGALVGLTRDIVRELPKSGYGMCRGVGGKMTPPRALR